MEAVILEERAALGITIIKGKEYMSNAKGAFVPLELIKPSDKLQDETVRKVMAYAIDISAQIGRFRANSMKDLDSLDALLEQEYGAKPGGAKGNRTYYTIDGLMRIKVSIGDFERLGPELQVGKRLIDECMMEWSSEGRPEIRAIITKAFDTDKEGKVNIKEIRKLASLDIKDPRWLEAMRAISDAVEVLYSKQYVSFHFRKSLQDDWTAVTVNIAKA